MMRPGSYFINTSRGELVQEESLLDVLRSGHLAGAALDVLCDEQHHNGMGHRPLVAYARAHDNVIITPHIGGCTVESMENTELFMAKKLCAVGLSGLGREYEAEDPQALTLKGSKKR